MNTDRLSPALVARIDGMVGFGQFLARLEELADWAAASDNPKLREWGAAIDMPVGDADEVCAELELWSRYLRWAGSL